MESLAALAGEPPRKRQRLSPSPEAENQGHDDSTQESSRVSSMKPFDSSFRSNPLISPTTPFGAATDYILDITKYIPAGCLRMQRSGISSEVWKSCASWAAFAHPRDIYLSNGGPYLLNALQEILLRTKTVQPYEGLHHAGWIRMEFKTMNESLGQIRVYILSGDVGNSFIDRQQPSLRRAMQLLLGEMDISRPTWDGKWNMNSPFAHVDSELDEDNVEDETTLFEIFNTLPSPKPEPENVMDPSARDAMYRILDSDIEGLTTKMHTYQRRSAALMLQREIQPARIVDPRVRPVMDQNGLTWYCDLDSGSCFREPRTYEAAKGGICAETMGLGKTLICLALILATRELSSQIPVEYSVGTIPTRPATASLKEMCAATIGRTGVPWKSHFASLEAEGYDYSQCIDAIKAAPGYYELPSPPPRRQSRNPVTIPDRKIYLTTATLVIVPPNLVQQWRCEIDKHTKGLNVLVMNNLKTELPPAVELAEYDIILFSKQRFVKEAKDGSDEQGRRESTTSRVCRCPYIGDTRARDCTCFNRDEVYHSPLKDLHFKRLITDEGHTFGNASSSSATEGITVVDYLQLSARWIVSGTPTQGLYGAEVSMSSESKSQISGKKSRTNTSASSFTSTTQDISASSDTEITRTGRKISQASKTRKASAENLSNFYKQERKDLEKLGNIATTYLKSRPWANTREDEDMASWSQYVMQPRHGSKSRGNMDCLRSTLEGMIIRHRPADVKRDVSLPPLHQDVISLDGSVLDKLSLNTFSMMIVSNAITSERKDADYLFHPKQRKALQDLVSNLRQASFFWSGYTKDDVQITIDIAKKFLEKGEVPVSVEDEVLLAEAINVGEAVVSNEISQAISTLHEMPMSVDIDCEDEVKAAWALDGQIRHPTLMGASMLHSMQKFVSHQLWKEDPTEGLAKVGLTTMQAALKAQEPASTKASSKQNVKDGKASKKANDPAPTLAGGVKTGDGSSPKKRPRKASVDDLEDVISGSRRSRLANPGDSDFRKPLKVRKKSLLSMDEPEEMVESDSMTEPKSVLKNQTATEVAGTLNPSSPLASATITSTASAKLSYLMDRIVAHQADEKILIFYEADNVAYYIAQALECLNIKHLIYAKTLTTARRAQYVVTFNQSPLFRVLLMDVSQAAFGLDLSSASRVFFVNPVFSPQVEAQAVKRAHRIGQTKPVFVETLVLKGSIEEAILERRKDMSDAEHNRCKNILDDRTMYDWIRNARFIPTPGYDMSSPDQMAQLETPQLIFGRTAVGVQDPDADLLSDPSSSPKADHDSRIEYQYKTGTRKRTGKRKNKAEKATKTSQSAMEPTKSVVSDDDIEYEPSPRKRRRVGFALPAGSSTRSSESNSVLLPASSPDDTTGMSEKARGKRKATVRFSSPPPSRTVASSEEDAEQAEETKTARPSRIVKLFFKKSARQGEASGSSSRSSSVTNATASTGSAEETS